MKKIALSIFMFLMLGNFVFSQDNDFISYNKIINKAELAIVDSSYSDAIHYYEKAFLLLKIPKGKDLHNAAICSMYIGDFNKTFSYFDLLVEKGIEKEYFENETFKPLEKDNRYKEFLESYEKNHKDALSRKNLKLLKEIKQMSKNDQELSQLKDYDPAKFPEFIDTVVSNIKRLEVIIAKYGFPNEDMLGIRKPYHPVPFGFMIVHYYQIENFKLALQDSAIYNNPKFVSRRHIVDIDFSKFNILELNKAALKQGEFSPYIFANNQDKFETTYGSVALIQVDNHVGIIRHSGEKEQQINANRKEIGLESLKDYYKKI